MALSRTKGSGNSAAGWAAAALVVVVAAICIRLGFWQLDRLEQRRSVNAVVARGMGLPAVELDRTFLDSISRDPNAFLYRRVRATGRYEESREVLLRGRVFEGMPGVHLITPFRLATDSSLLLVNRGWLPSSDGATVDPRVYRAQSDAATIEGILQLVPESGPQAAPSPVVLPDTQIDTYRRLDRDIMADALGEAPAAIYLQLTPGPDTVTSPPVLVPPPTLDEGPHLGYAVQWFSFAAVAIGGFAVVLRMRRKASRQ